MIEISGGVRAVMLVRLFFFADVLREVTGI